MAGACCHGGLYVTVLTEDLAWIRRLHSFTAVEIPCDLLVSISLKTKLTLLGIA